MLCVELFYAADTPFLVLVLRYAFINHDHVMKEILYLQSEAANCGWGDRVEYASVPEVVGWEAASPHTLG